MASVASIGFIGGGNMAEAIIKGLVRGTFPAEGILVAELEERRRTLLAERYGVRTTAELDEVVRTCEVVILAVKPQAVAEVLPGVSAHFSGEQLLVSILAGISTAALESHFDGSPRVVRVMPNTPALVGAAATGLCPGRYCRHDDLLLVQRLFEAIGTALVVSEKEMDAVTGLSGSGPAYVYTIIEALADGGVLEGLPRPTALALAVQTVLGAAKLVQESGEHPAALRDKVCSPGGTTIAGVKTLEEQGLRAALMGAVSSASRRSRELGGK